MTWACFSRISKQNLPFARQEVWDRCRTPGGDPDAKNESSENARWGWRGAGSHVILLPVGASSIYFGGRVGVCSLDTHSLELKTVFLAFIPEVFIGSKSFLPLFKHPPASSGAARPPASGGQEGPVEGAGSTSAAPQSLSFPAASPSYKRTDEDHGYCFPEAG